MRSLLVTLSTVALLLLILARMARRRRLRRRREVARVLRGLADGTLERWRWNDFLAAPLEDPALERIRDHAAGLPERYPPERSGAWLNPDGVAIVEHYLASLDGGER